MKYISAWILVWMAYVTSAQIGGTATYRFLSLPPSAAQIALGGKQMVSLHDSPLQNFSNPALIDSMQARMPALNYSHWIADINYGNLAYVWDTRYGLFFTGIHYLNYGRFTEANADGEITGTFGAMETAVVLGYAYPLGERWRVGMNVKWIHSVLAGYRSDGLAVDLGLDYRNRSGGEWALVLRNAGRQLTTYNGTQEALPLEVDLTYAQLLEHAPFRLFVTAENLQEPAIAFANPVNDRTDPNGEVTHENITLVHHIFRHLIVGTEFFPRKRFHLRAGYNFRRAAELGFKDINFSSGLSFGLGLRLRHFSLEYGYGQMHYAGNNHFISLHIFLHKPHR
ncbi:MAG: type IX secretion system protein PorQ [Chlorobi bacterium]|nr:type IX secretion system protein PorQ [Chlorobiota bacterium]